MTGIDVPAFVRELLDDADRHWEAHPHETYEEKLHALIEQADYRERAGRG